MYNIKTFNKIAKEGLKLFTEDYKIDKEENYDAVLLRSYKLHDEPLSSDCKVIARAGAGVNNIPIEECSKKGIVVMNTPGANANAVKELVIAAFLMASRNIVQGANWTSTLKGNDDVAKTVENEKSNFKGNELKGKKVGVIGLGAIGVLVANALNDLGMKVYGYDPYLSVKSAWSINQNINRSFDIERIFKYCDYVTIHVPLMEATRDTVNAEILSTAKNGIKIINLARGGLVNDDAIVDAVESGKVSCYVTDFPNDKVVGRENIMCLPHIGASTPESEINCAVMATEQVKEFLETGNIKHSVNYPDCDMGAIASKARICITHENIPNMLGQFSSILASNNVNIANMLNKSRDNYAYTMIDIDSSIDDYVIETLQNIEAVSKIRIIYND